MKMRPFSKMAFLTMTLIFLLLVTACDKVTLPTSDDTPPSLRWTVYNYETSDTTNISGSGQSVSVGPGNRVRITLVAEDPQGIHKISLGSGGSWTCTSGDLGQTSQWLGGTDEQVLNPDSNNQVLTSIFLLRDAELNQSCPSGFVYGGGSVTLSGTGENYFGGITSATLTITRP